MHAPKPLRPAALPHGIFGRNIFLRKYNMIGTLLRRWTGPTRTADNDKHRFSDRQNKAGYADQEHPAKPAPPPASGPRPALPFTAQDFTGRKTSTGQKKRPRRAARLTGAIDFVGDDMQQVITRCRDYITKCEAAGAPANDAMHQLILKIEQWRRALREASDRPASVKPHSEFATAPNPCREEKS
jgi:hypothetical protein